MSQEHLLDARDLPMPEPLKRALAALDALPTGHYLRLWLSRDPVLLYPILSIQNFDFITRSRAQADYEILIWHHGDVVAERSAHKQAESHRLT